MATSTPRAITVTDDDKPATVKRHRNNGPLHDLLLRACPPNAEGEKSITILSRKLKLSASAIHRWIKRNKIPPLRAKQVVDVSGGRVTLAQFSPFIYL